MVLTKWVFRILGTAVALVALAIVFVWLLLAVPMFSDLRRGVVEGVLSDQIGKPLYVNDDVSVALGTITDIYVGGVVIPSPTMQDVALAELRELALELDVVALLNGKLHFDNLTIDGLQANFLTALDGTMSWRKRPKQTNDQTETEEEKGEEKRVTESSARPDASPGQNGILAFLSDKNVRFSDIGLDVSDEVSGFSFDFKLASLELAQVDDDTRTTVVGAGTVNGQIFEIDGNYPRGAPFTTHATFGELFVNFDGEPLPSDQGTGFRGDLDIDTGEFGDFLETVGLQRVLEGNGRMGATIVAKDTLQVEDIALVIELAKGQKLTAEGSIDDLYAASGLDLAFDARLYAEGEQVRTADTVEDLRFTGLEMEVGGSLTALEFKNLLFETNAFNQSLESIGPSSIERIQRTPEGTLAMLGIKLQAGPVDDPVLQAEGEILDLLQLKEVLFDGSLKGAATLLLTELDPEFVAQFGGLDSTFSLSNAGGSLALKQLTTRSYGTDLWDVDLSMSVEEVQGLGGLDFNVDMQVADGATFLSALRLEPVDVGFLGIRASTSRQDDEFRATAAFDAGTSDLAANLDATFGRNAPVIRGQINSEKVAIADLKNLGAALKQMQNLVAELTGDRNASDDALDSAKASEEPEVQPLVLPKEPTRPTDLLNVAQTLATADIEVLIDFKEISGQQGVTSVSSELTAKEGNVTLGPIDMAYGGGSFNLTAAIDLADSPDYAAVSGATGGWDFGEILDELGIGIDAYGILSGNFNVSGNITNVQTFANSMRGTAELTMSQGYVSTSLLELAGLGIFPWLFSEELRQGYTDITCVAAPLRIDAGRVTSDAIVAETASVQLVAKGEVDWINDSIALRAEPRRVGRPLARSAWPFDVTGKLSEPNFKLDIGGSRSESPTGADEMPANRTPCVPDMQQLR